MQCSSVLRRRLIKTVKLDGHDNAENHSRTLDGEKIEPTEENKCHEYQDIKMP